MVKNEENGYSKKHTSFKPRYVYFLLTFVCTHEYREPRWTCSNTSWRGWSSLERQTPIRRRIFGWLILLEMKYYLMVKWNPFLPKVWQFLFQYFLIIFIIIFSGFPHCDPGQIPQFAGHHGGPAHQVRGKVPQVLQRKCNYFNCLLMYFTHF